MPSIPTHIKTFLDNMIKRKLKEKTMIKRVNDMLKEKEFKITTEATNRSIIKKYLRENYNDKFDWSPLDMPKDKTEQIFERAKEIHLNREMVDISEDTIRSIIALRDNKQDIASLISYAILISGRRFNEILKSTFNKVDENTISSPDLSKKAMMLSKFPVLTNSDEFLALITDIRKLYDNTNSDDSYNNKVNRRLRPLGLSSHKLRAIYVSYMLKFRNNRKIHPTAFIQTILQHVGSDAATHYDYINLQLNDDVFM
jgi:hypothetical protein